MKLKQVVLEKRNRGYVILCFLIIIFIFVMYLTAIIDNTSISDERVNSKITNNYYSKELNDKDITLKENVIKFYNKVIERYVIYTYKTLIKDPNIIPPIK